MDPAWIALIGTVGGGVVIKFTEDLMRRHKSKTAGSIVISTDYKDRWRNPEYVAMIHDTRIAEKELLGETFTECFCEGHLPPTDLMRYDQAVSEKIEIYADTQVKPIRTIAKHGSVCFKDGCSNHIPASINDLWCWDHTVRTGVKSYARNAKKEVEELKTQVIFTKSGMQMISMGDFNKIASDLRQTEREAKALESKIEDYRDKFLDKKACYNCGMHFPSNFRVKGLCLPCNREYDRHGLSKQRGTLSTGPR